MEERNPGRLTVEEGEDRLELRLEPKAVPPQVLFAGDHGIGRLLERRQRPDQLQQQRHVVRGRKADGDRRFHRSRHSRAPLPGGPKSCGASPE